MKSALATALLTLVLAGASPGWAQSTGQTGGGAAGSSAVTPLNLFPPGTVNPNLMRPSPGPSLPPGPYGNGSTASGAATADGQNSGSTARRSGGGGGVAPGTSGGGSSGGRSGSAGGSGGSAASSTSAGSATSGSRGGGSSGGTASSGGSGGSTRTPAPPVGRAAQWVLCPPDDPTISAELTGGLGCAP